MCDPTLIAVITKHLEDLGYVIERPFLGKAVVLCVTRPVPVERYDVFFINHIRPGVLFLNSNLKDLAEYLSMSDPGLLEKIVDAAHRYID